MKKIIYFLVFLGLIAVSGCMIDNPNKKSVFIPSHIKKLYVFNFLNYTKNDRIVSLLRNELDNGIAFSSDISLVKIVTEANGTIEGKISSLFLQPISRLSTGEIDEARYVLQVEVSLDDLVKQKKLFDKVAISVVEIVRLRTGQVTDMNLILDSMAKKMAGKIVLMLETGEIPDINSMYGYEDRVFENDNGTLIGKERKNYDLNNDGIDDRQQPFLNTNQMTNTGY